MPSVWHVFKVGDDKTILIFFSKHFSSANAVFFDPMTTYFDCICKDGLR